MATGVTVDTWSEQPYLTVAEFKNAPTSIDIDNLVVGGNQNAQDAELSRAILRASSYMDEYFNQNLCASTYTETQRTRMTGQGYLVIHPYNAPVISLQSLQYGTDPNNLVTLPDPSTSWFENQEILVPLSQIATTYSSQGPLAFGFPASGRNQVFCKYTYSAGWVNTTIAAPTNVGATSLTVAQIAGVKAGQELRIYDGANSETVTVASNYVYGSSPVTLTAPMVFAHGTGAAIGNMPNAIKQACIILTSVFIKVRGDNSLTMAVTTRSTQNIAGSERYGSEVALALDMVNKYRRIR